MVSMNGPLTGSAMTIDGRMEAIKITLSHPIVLLIIHAVKNLIPEKVCSHFCTTAHTLYMTLFMYCVLCIVCTLTSVALRENTAVVNCSHFNHIILWGMGWWSTVVDRFDGFKVT